MEWFNKNHIKINNLNKNKLFKNNIKGYVLPHASTKYTGNIISKTLRNMPQNFFDKIMIIYYPAMQSENIILNNNEKYYHEYYVIWKSLEFVLKKYWKFDKKKFIGINVKNLNNNDEKQKLNLIFKNLNKTLIIISADFSHFLPLQQAVEKENCAAHAIVHRNIYNKLPCLKVVDTIESFQLLYDIIPENWYLQWVGRTRSPGLKGVGYLSFVLKKPQTHLKLPNGIFITAYDDNMNQRECLGEWFTKNKKYNKQIQDNLLDKVINLAQTTSRLTGGKYLNIPVNNYTITYLYKEKSNFLKTRKIKFLKKKTIKNKNNNKFIRGYHSIKGDAFFLSDVMLENVFDNGIWIKSNDKEWPESKEFDIKETLIKIKKKSLGQSIIDANFEIDNNYELYYSDVFYGKIL